MALEEENSLVLDILQDLQTDSIKTEEEIDSELKQKIYQVFQPFLNFNQNQDNFAEVYQRLKGYQFVLAQDVQEGDYLRYLNPKYFYYEKIFLPTSLLQCCTTHCPIACTQHL